MFDNTQSGLNAETIITLTNGRLATEICLGRKLNDKPKEQRKMSLGMILLIVLVLALLGVIPTWGHSKSWGYGPSGGLGLVLLIVLILVLMGKI
jgi:hypothetical protein